MTCLIVMVLLVVLSECGGAQAWLARSGVVNVIIPSGHDAANKRRVMVRVELFDVHRAQLAQPHR